MFISQKGGVMTTVTASVARKSFGKILRETQVTHEPIRVTSSAGSAVILSEDDYESLIETLNLLESPGFRTTLRNAEKEYSSGDTCFFEECFGEPL
jgi:antitoxin YefM